MPFKDPAKQKAYNKAYQKPWMLNKRHERKASGICRVSGCGSAICEASKQYCATHREQNRIDSQNYRNRKKVAGHVS